MNYPLEDLELSVRASNVAKKLGVTDLDGLRKLTKEDVMAVKGAGIRVWQNIAEVCANIPAEAPVTVDPSKVTYDALVGAFARFNEKLFEGRLPPVMLVLHRKKNAHGYFWAQQWKGRTGDATVDEIALNPETMGRTVPEVLSTLVHEMTHLEQQHFGKPGKNGHHNKEWGDLMDRVGLTPRGVGKCEGKRTGRTVSHDILEGGPFDLECKAMIDEGIDLSYIANSFNKTTVKKRDRSKVKHTCPECEANVWCKEGMHVVCGDCDRQMGEA